MFSFPTLSLSLSISLAASTCVVQYVYIQCMGESYRCVGWWVVVWLLLLLNSLIPPSPIVWDRDMR